MIQWRSLPRRAGPVKHAKTAHGENSTCPDQELCRLFFLIWPSAFVDDDDRQRSRLSCWGWVQLVGQVRTLYKPSRMWTICCTCHPLKHVGREYNELIVLGVESFRQQHRKALCWRGQAICGLRAPEWDADLTFSIRFIELVQLASKDPAVEPTRPATYWPPFVICFPYLGVFLHSYKHIRLAIPPRGLFKSENLTLCLRLHISLTSEKC